MFRGTRFPLYIYAGSMRRGRHRLEIKMTRGPEKAKRTVSFKRC